MPDETELLKVSLRSIDTRLKPLVDELALVIRSLPASEERANLTKAYNAWFPVCFWFRIAFGDREGGQTPEIERLPD